MTHATLDRPPAPPTDTDPHAATLHALLSDLVGAHEALLTAAAEHREAIRAADTNAMASASVRVDAICRDIARLDEHRKALTAALAPDQPDATLSFLASQLAAPERGAALELAGRLRELIIKARTEQRRLRAAADAMLSHVRGIVQQIQQSLNHAGTYGRAGRVDAGATVVSGIDMTS